MARKIVSLPYFRFFPADFLMSDLVSIMGPEERGAYITLLARAWNDSTCSIPSDETMLAKLTGLESRWESHRELILKGFPPHPTLQGRLANPRLLEERAFSEAQFSKVSEQRKVAAAGRHKPQANRDEPTTACHIIEEKRVKEKTTPKAPKGAGERESLRADFDAFWNVWPRKVCKDAAEKAFAKAIKAAPLATILAGVEAGKRTDQWRKDGGQFIPHAATWLNGKRWMDEPEPEEREPFAAENDPDFVSDLLTFDPIVEAARKRATA